MGCSKPAQLISPSSIEQPIQEFQVFNLCMQVCMALKTCSVGRPKRPAKHHWLGQPLPDQLPNTTQAHQTALLSFLQDLARTVRQIPTRYAPVRHFVLNYSDSSKRRPLGQSRSARPVVLKQGETTLARSLFSFCPAPRKQRSTCMC